MKIGAPKWVYQNHKEIDCTKKEQHERKLSGGSSNKSFFQQNMKKELRTMKKKYQKLKYYTRELCVSCKKTKGNAKKHQKVTSWSSSEGSYDISDESNIDSE